MAKKIAFIGKLKPRRRIVSFARKMNEIKCSVTVMLILDNKIGFIRRDKNDTFGGLLVAPGGKVKGSDGIVIDGIRYNCIESAAVREVLEETNIGLFIDELKYFTSITLKNMFVVISLYSHLRNRTYDISKLIFLSKDEIIERNDFVPGMKQEALMLYYLGLV